MKLDFGLSNSMLDDIPSKWKDYHFGITYSVTLNKDDLETSFAIRNTGEEEWEFQTLFHTYLAVGVSRITQILPMYMYVGLYMTAALTPNLTEYLHRLHLRPRIRLLQRQNRRRQNHQSN